MTVASAEAAERRSAAATAAATAAARRGNAGKARRCEAAEAPRRLAGEIRFRDGEPPYAGITSNRSQHAIRT
ncbi:hypothetical protein J2853_004819 [Streptosporangium lutulentum]|uniref:Uncharacterized protein n=1 Tax=Streptosporangium lutulentum TaxID=1461250 RepID=A0ABT9QFS0_9ACTN|nr:hypothetical protein [Streptosporangium lutulentum]